MENVNNTEDLEFKQCNTAHIMDTYNEYPYNQLYVYHNGLVISQDTYRDIQEKDKRITKVDTSKYNFRWLD